MKAIIIKRLSKGAKNSLFLADLEIQKLFMLENEFKRNYRKGFDFYRLGAWSAAKEFLRMLLKRNWKMSMMKMDLVCTFLNIWKGSILLRGLIGEDGGGWMMLCNFYW